MKHFIKFLGIASAIFLVIGITGCPTNAKNGNSGSTENTEEGGGVPAVHAVTMAAITPPAGGQIVGADPSETLPGMEDYWKGVFIADRTVILSGFEMAESETTYALWKEVYDWATHADRGANKYTFANKGEKGKDGSGDTEQPVTKVNWCDVIVWCNAYTEMTGGNADNCVYRKSDKKTVLRDAAAEANVNAAYFDKTKKGFRLPTEAEWEYAARSNTDGTLNPLNRLSGASGDYKNAEDCKAVAWYKENSNDTAHNVKGLKENAQKLYDMSGNVWEWCWDWFDNNVKAGDEGANPVTDPAGAPTGAYRVIRGGSCIDIADDCLPGSRYFFSAGRLGDSMGFRVCRSRP